MNKQDITIVVLLIILLFGWMFHQNRLTRARNEAWQRQQAELAAQVQESNDSALPGDTVMQATQSTDDSQLNASAVAVKSAQSTAPVDSGEAQAEESSLEEHFAYLENDELRIAISTKGAAVSSATLLKYRESLDKNSEPLSFKYEQARALSLNGLPGASAKNDFTIVENSPSKAVFQRSLTSGLVLTRTFSLANNYQIILEDTYKAPAEANNGSTFVIPSNSISIGSITRQSRGATAVLSIDNLAVAIPGAKSPKVFHWEKKRLVNKMFTGSNGGGGCSSTPDGSLFPQSVTQSSSEAQQWVAMKTRFFAQALTGDNTPTSGFAVTAYRSTEKGPLIVNSLSGELLLPEVSIAPGQETTRSFRLYVGPKKLSIIKTFAKHSSEIMEFGTFKWLCVILIPILNGFNAIFHNYGVAIIVLTLMVRLIFWPLTRKSNESMKKMGTIQPQLKEIQEKFKGDPQKLQQETMRLYRENHVNPMSSCLPMLIQIPVFIALFVVLRTATELRFAPFLWIRDLSEPENLLAGKVPGAPALNILPFLMAGTMFLQSKLTPSMGDPSQQKMMMVMMPLMMFFMFYSMPSALLLYWTVSQFLAIVQLLRQRKARAAASAATGNQVDAPLSRQERRRLERESTRQ